MRNLHSRLGLVALLLAGGSVLMAQQSTSALKGRVRDSATGDPKVGVTVTVVNTASQYTRATQTDAKGLFGIYALPVGHYEIIYTYGGRTIKQARQANLGMEVDASLKWPSEAGATVEVVAVTAGVDTVNTTSAEVGVNVESTILSKLPITDRNVNSAAILAPGVQIIQGSQVDPTKKTSTYIVSGEGQGRGTNFAVDGADNNSSDVGGSVMPVPYDAIDQFQVVTNQYKAEFGRSNAGFLNVVTKSGGNDFTGIVNTQFTNDSMRAMKTDEHNKLSNDQSIYSAMVSGPILKDKLFYMVATERTAQNTTELFDSRAVAVYPSLGNTKNTMDKYNLYMKVDWNINSMWLASFKYARYYDKSTNQTFPHADAVQEYVNPTMLGTNRDDTTSYGAKLTGTFGNIVWESTINTFDYTNSIRPSIAGPNNGTSIEIRPMYLATTELWRSGQDPNSYQNTGVKRLQWKNELTWTLPDHNLKAGVDYQKTDYPLETYFYANPTVYVMGLAGVPFGQEWSSSVQADRDVIRAYLTVPQINPATSFKGWGLYLQDDWTVSPKLSIYAGVRVDWDTQLDYYKQFDGLYQQIHAANPDLAGIGTQAPRTHHYGSPRFQVLYKPYGDDSLTFKLGYGRFVASTIDNVVGFSRALNGPVNGLPSGYVYNNAALAAHGKGPNANGIASFKAGTVLTQVNGVDIVLPADLTPYNYANDVNGLRTLFSDKIRGMLTTANFGTGGKQLLASDFAYPTTETVTLGCTYKLSDKAALDMTLLYSKTKHQTSYFTTDGTASACTSYGPLGAAGGDMGDSIFMSNQTSSSRQLQVKYTYSTSHMSFLATFVAKQNKSSQGGDGNAFSSNGEADFYGGGANYPWLTQPERMAAGSEDFSGSFAWSYHFDFGTNVSLLGQWHSGKYYDISLGYSPNPGYGPGSSTDDADPNPILGYGKGDWNLDLSCRISHTIKFGKKMELEPFVQVKNILNNYDYGNNYDGSIYGADGDYNSHLGQRYSIFQANDPRTIVVGVRFAW